MFFFIEIVCFFFVIITVYNFLLLYKIRLWIIKIRAIRRRLKIKKDRNEISNKIYWEVYKMAGSGQLRNVKHMEEVVNSKQ